MQKDDEFDFFDLDELRLDEEWSRQPKLFFEYARRLAELRGEFEKAKAAKEIAVAELDKEIRTDPASYDIPKLTEGSVERAIILQAKYQKANMKVLEAKHEMDMMQAAVDALDHRKKALEKKVDLWLAGYFAEPRAGKHSKEHVEEREKERIRKKVKMGG